MFECHRRNDIAHVRIETVERFVSKGVAFDKRDSDHRIDSIVFK